jgi:uncharacterized protein YndB with AHSA1/START domain
VTFAAHCFAAWPRADPEVVWTALTDPGQTPGFLCGLAAHSTWIPGAPIDFRCGEDVQVSGRVLCVQRDERLSYVLQSAPADSLQEAEDIWLPVLEALQQLVNPATRYALYIESD